MAEMDSDELAAWNEALQEFAPKKAAPIPSDPTKFTAQELIAFCKQVIELLDIGIAKVANPNSVIYFKGIKRYMEKEQLKAESSIELIDQL
jgi:hypothetical protein